MIEKEVNKLHPREMNKAIHLQTDLAAEFPLYIFLPDSKEFLLYSFSIRSLLEDDRVEKPLNILSDGVSFLMQSGVIPPPRTIYSNIYILGIGDEAKVATDGKKIVLDFGHDFPFRHADRLPPEAMKPDEDKILELVGKAVSDSLDSSRRTYLFHSAGKDSNTVALAIAEAGW